MQPIAVDALLLRSAAPDLALTVGRSLGARVLERGPHGVGILNLAGAILTAELPEHVRAGDRLRLVVRETTTERVLLQIAPQPANVPGLVPPAPGDVRLPGDGRIAVVGREGGGGDGADGDDAGAVTLRCELPALGRVELRVVLDAGGTRARVSLGAGVALELGEERAGELRAALTRAAGRPAEVTVVPRRDPFDAYA